MKSRTGTTPIRRSKAGACERCDGLLVREWFSDWFMGWFHVEGQRCCNCGWRKLALPVKEVGRWELSQK